MPSARTATAVHMELAPDSLVQSNLSGAACTGGWVWVAGDEDCGLDCLRPLDSVGRETICLGEVRDFRLADLPDLPGMAGEEADLKGMAVADGFPWVVGSHGLKRKDTEPDRDHADNAKRLAKDVLDGNRRLTGLRGPVRFESALTVSMPPPHGRGTNRVEVISDLLRHD